MASIHSDGAFCRGYSGCLHGLFKGKIYNYDINDECKITEIPFLVQMVES